MALVLLQRLQAVAKRRSLRPMDFLADFDRLHSGRITAQQFTRGLGSSGFQLTPSECDVLANHFADRDSPQFVRYTDFCNALVDVDAGLERSPTKTPGKFSFERHPVRIVDPQVQERVDAFLVRVCKAVSSRGLQPREFFTDFDKLKTGFVSEAQFRRCLKNSVGEFDEQTFADLVAKYAWRDDDLSGDAAALAGKVNYLALINDIEAGLEDQHSLFLFRDDNVGAANVQRAATKTQEIDYDAIAESAVGSIRSQVLRSRVFVRDFFRDWDKRGSGYIERNMFLRVLSKLRIRFSDNEGQALIKKYEGRGDQVKYSDFCVDVESVLDADKPLEETRRIARPNAAYPSLTAEEEFKAQGILSRIKRLLKARRILIMPVFHDFDRTHRMTVTEGHFRRACTTLNLGMSPDELTLLIHKYGVVASDGSPLVAYSEFVNTVEEEEETVDMREDALQKKKAAEKLRQRAAADHVVGSNDVNLDALIAKIQKYTVTRRARIGTYFPDFDKLRCGAVPVPRFRQAIGMAGVMLSDTEIDALAKKYQTDKIPNGVDWVKFAADVSSIETVAGLERAPTATVVKTSFEFNPETDIVGDDGLITPDLKDNFQHVIKRLQKLIYEREIIIEQPFRRFDKLNKGWVTVSQFQAALTYLAMVPAPSAGEVDALLAYFAVPATEYVSYVALARVSYAMFYDSEGHRKLRTYDMGLGHGLERDQLKPRRVKAGAIDVVIDVQSVLAKLRADKQRRRITLADLFVDYDRLHSGKVPSGKLATVLASAGLVLSGKELEVLTDEYRDVKDARLIVYKPMLEGLGEL